MLSRLFTEYWTCFMEGFHCSIDDIPCYNANLVGGGPPPSPVSTGEPLSAAGPWGSSVSSDRDFRLSGSPTAAPTAAGVWVLGLGDACADVADTCVQDSECVDCYSDAFEILMAPSPSEESYSECRSDYLSAAAAASASGAAGTCDVLGSAFCCSGTGAECQVGSLSVAYWGGVFDFFECSTEEAGCVGGGSQSARSDDEVYPVSEEDYYAGGVADGGGGPATPRAGGVAGGGRRSSAVANAYWAAALTATITAFVAPLA